MNNKGKYFLCIDNGLTVIKSAIFNSYGSIITIFSTDTPVINNGPSSEIGMDLLWKKTSGVIKNLIDTTGIKPSDIIAVSNTGYGAGIFLIDKDGDPLRNAITSMDSRANDLLAKWKDEKTFVFEKTYTNVYSSQAIPLLLWLKDNEKYNFNEIGKILMAKDWIRYKLTGSFATDLSDMTNSGLINLNTRQYDPDFYMHFGLSDIREKLPPLKNCEEIAGYVSKKAAGETGLKPGTPVVCGLLDVTASSAGSGISGEDKFSIIAGTWSINTALNKALIKSSDIMSCTIYSDQDYFLYDDGSPTSSVNLEWFLKNIIEKTTNISRQDIYNTINTELEKIKNRKRLSGLFYYPFLYKSKLSNKLKGAFIGLDPSTGIFEMIYAIYEGVVFAHLIHIQNLRKGGINREEAVLSGGASKSNVWCQMFADILNLKITTSVLPELGLLGASIYAMIGTGYAKNLKDAQEKTVKIKEVFFPDNQRHMYYKEKFSEFLKIYNLINDI